VDNLWFNGRANTSFFCALVAAKGVGLVPCSYIIPQTAKIRTLFSSIVVRIPNRMKFLLESAERLFLSQKKKSLCRCPRWARSLPLPQERLLSII
jgi:hypothetical protein